MGNLAALYFGRPDLAFLDSGVDVTLSDCTKEGQEFIRSNLPQGAILLGTAYIVSRAAGYRIVADAVDVGLVVEELFTGRRIGGGKVAVKDLTSGR